MQNSFQMQLRFLEPSHTIWGLSQIPSSWPTAQDILALIPIENMSCYGTVPVWLLITVRWPASSVQAAHAALERSGFWERRKNQTRSAITNKNNQHSKRMQHVTWQFSLAQGSTSHSPKLTQKKSWNLLTSMLCIVWFLATTSCSSRLHRHVCNWRGPLVIVTACHLVHKRARASTATTRHSSCGGDNRQDDGLGTLRPT